jgi:NAD(P)-dependent dehydrogenase (short-subunit alcohol dehydrogenase family)
MQEPRSAIVTGAGKRVGAHIASALAERGWSVIAHVRRPDDEAPAGTKKVAVDLARLDCADIIFEAAEGLPPVRLLVNNASRFSWDGFGELNAEEFDAHMQVNVRAPMLLIDALARTHQGGDALVVNLLDSKLLAPNADFLSYTVSKQALLGLTQAAARTLTAAGIRVNAVAPALILKSPGQSEDNFRRMHERNPLRRGVTPADVMAAIDFLAGCPVVTGEILTLDGGQRFDPPQRDVQFLED